MGRTDNSVGSPMKWRWLAADPDSALGLVWRRDEDTPALKAFAQYLS
jgi:hypothetical protein